MILITIVLLGLYAMTAYVLLTGHILQHTQTYMRLLIEHFFDSNICIRCNRMFLDMSHWCTQRPRLVQPMKSVRITILLTMLPLISLVIVEMFVVMWFGGQVYGGVGQKVFVTLHC